MDSGPGHFAAALGVGFATATSPVIASVQPVIVQHPSSAAVCPGGSVSLTVSLDNPCVVGSLDYRWQSNVHPVPGQWLDITDGDIPGVGTLSGSATSTLTVSSVATNAAGHYRCVVSSACGSVTSDVATLTVCPADFSCSGSLSVQDIFDFLAAYFGGDVRADFNTSGATSVQDIFDFLAAYFAGCP